MGKEVATKTQEPVTTSFDSNPKQEWAQAQKARTINL